MFQIQIEARDARGSTGFEALCHSPAAARRTLRELTEADRDASEAVEQWQGLADLELSTPAWPAISVATAA